MLRNIIFDMGNVLIKYDPVYFIERAGIEDPKDMALLLWEIFRSPHWPLLDTGELTEAELMERIYPHLPERLHSIAHYLVFHWDKPLIPIPGMKEFIEECKQNGLGIYLLSNASFRQIEYWKDIPGNEYFDGSVVSAFQGYVKPMPEIYEYLLNRFRLKAEECLFVDDVAENVMGAQRVGMMGFLFDGKVSALRKAVYTLIPKGGAASC